MATCQNGKDYNQITSCTGNVVSNNIHVAVIYIRLDSSENSTSMYLPHLTPDYSGNSNYTESLIHLFRLFGPKGLIMY